MDGKEAGDLRTEWTPYLSLFDLTGHPAIAMPAGSALTNVRSLPDSVLTPGLIGIASAPDVAPAA